MNTDNLSANLRQGLQYNKYQNKIINKVKNSDKYKLLVSKGNGSDGVELVEGFTNPLSTPITQEQQIGSSEQTKHILSKSQVSQSEMAELEKLQTTYKSLLEQFNTAQTQLSSSAKEYVAMSNLPNPKKDINIFVNKMLPDDTTASYLGAYNDNSESPAMTPLYNNWYTYDQCKKAAIDGGSLLFGLENVGASGDPNSAYCAVSNDLVAAQKYGQYVSLCSQGSDGQMYGGAWTNAIYERNGDTSTYLGCYKDDAARAMTMSGPDLSSYSPVFLCGQNGSAPWGNTESFGDPYANWIWYTENAQNGAPNNSGAPVTLIYNFNYTGTSYLNVTLTGMCDDKCDMYLNSNFIGSFIGGWGAKEPSKTIDISIAPGPNYIAASVVNTGGPAGFILSAINAETKTFLFETDADWKFTNILPSQLVPNGQNYSVETCQKYAADGGYKYFGLQNGTVGNSQCFVSNNINDATKYGKSEGTTTSAVDGKAYGLANINALYQLDAVGIPGNMGLAGYVDKQGIMTKYPASMVGTDGKITNNATCSKNVTNIDTAQYQKLSYYTDLLMSPDTTCGLSKAVEPANQSLEQIRSQLVAAAESLVNKITSLETLNTDLNNQTSIDKSALDQNLQTYKDTITKYKKATDMTNINGILSDSDIVVLKENYTYIFWSILAIAVVIVAMNLIRK